MASTTTMDATNLPHDNLQAEAIALIFVFPVIATIALALRVYSRSLTRTFALDDVLILFAGVLYWADTFASYEVIKITYTGYHVWDIPTDFDSELGQKYGYAAELLYNPILALIKQSILIFLLRLTGQKTNIKRVIWGLLIFNGVMMIVTFLLTVFHCVPIAANWLPAAYPDSKCLNFADFVTGTASVAILTDVLVLILPTWIVYNLQIPRKQKTLLIGILSLGFVTIISGIVRVVLLDPYDRNLPVDYNYNILFCLSTIEVGLAFIAACAPAMKPIVVKILPKLLGITNSRNKTKNSQGANALEYQLDHMSRQTHRGDGDLERQKGIAVTTETEVKWQDSTGASKNGSSTESLV